MIAPAGMNNKQLGVLIRKAATQVHEDQLGFWKFEVEASVPSDTLQILLEANYDRALDARYCINNEVIWSAFLHPLAELNDRQFLNALDQVVTLKNNFGSSYTSSGLVFGG